MKPTIKDVQAFARYHGLPIPDGFVASAGGGIVYSHPENYMVAQFRRGATVRAGRRAPASFVSPPRSSRESSLLRALLGWLRSALLGLLRHGERLAGIGPRPSVAPARSCGLDLDAVHARRAAVRALLTEFADRAAAVPLDVFDSLTLCGEVLGAREVGEGGPAGEGLEVVHMPSLPRGLGNVKRSWHDTAEMVA